EEVNAAVEGAIRAGAEEVVVNDSHGTMRNVIPEELHPEASLITGSPKPMGMLEGLTAEFDCAFFLGYHAMAGGRGVLSHTYSGRTVRRVAVGGREVGELGLNAMVAHHLGVPVVLVTGDDALAGEAREAAPEAVAVATKRALGRYAAMCPPRRRVLEEIEEAAFQAVRRVAEGRVRVRPPAGPLDVEVEFTDPGMADVAHLVPGSVRVSPTTLRFRAEDALEAYRVVRAFMYLAIAVAR
ncbi:MAG: M55 family metallopeptidase, partial [Candidatus Korarchaeota archaeon]|nr:M55 family metallopeptidase [Candidatus Korarchaeota archaeon]